MVSRPGTRIQRGFTAQTTAFGTPPGPPFFAGGLCPGKAGQEGTLSASSARDLLEAGVRGGTAAGGLDQAGGAGVLGGVEQALHGTRLHQVPSVEHQQAVRYLGGQGLWWAHRAPAAPGCRRGPEPDRSAGALPRWPGGGTGPGRPAPGAAPGRSAGARGGPGLAPEPRSSGRRPAGQGGAPGAPSRGGRPGGPPGRQAPGAPQRPGPSGSCRIHSPLSRAPRSPVFMHRSIGLNRWVTTMHRTSRAFRVRLMGHPSHRALGRQGSSIDSSNSP